MNIYITNVVVLSTVPKPKLLNVNTSSSLTKYFVPQPSHHMLYVSLL
jgi:hypothetical protein